MSYIKMESDQPILSIIIPALNEEGNVAPCVHEIVQELGATFSYEILIFNDNSSDGTGIAAETLRGKFPFIRVFHNDRTMGLGTNYAKGVAFAAGKFAMMIPGDNEVRFASLAPALKQLGAYDILIAYTSNLEVRPRLRRVISRTFTHFLNFMFGLKVKYYNGCCIHKVELLRKMGLNNTSGAAYMAQILVRLLKSGATYTHVPMEVRNRSHGSSKALSLLNVMSVGQTFFSLIWEVYFSKKSHVPPSPEETLTP